MVISNHAPHTIEVAGCLVQQIAIQPADIGRDGTFRLERTLTGVEGGGFDISVVATMSPSSEIPVRAIVERTVDSWSRSNAISVSADARDLIASDVVEARPQLDEFFRSQLAFRPGTGSLLDWLVRDYCFDLRDRRLLPARLAEKAGPARAGFGNAFLSSGAAPVNLETSDVRSFSFLRYFGQLLSRITASQPVGNLMVTSQPDQQTITIDAYHGAEYFTDRSFVVSVGSYTVSVASCRKVVAVAAYEKVRVSCPDR